MMYTLALDEDKYRAAGGENTPLITMIRTVVAWSSGLSDVPELSLEHQENDKQLGTDLILPYYHHLFLRTFYYFCQTGIWDTMIRPKKRCMTCSQ